MGNINYWFFNQKSAEQGVGKDLNEIEAFQDLSVKRVPDKPPYEVEKPEIALVKDFWKEQMVVLHILRRFG